jgi:hypothetical protein
MPVHDWKRVDAGIFHDFLLGWIAWLRADLNDGLLPPGFHALIEQQSGQGSTAGPIEDLPNAAYRAARRTLAIRHVSGHRLVALLEIVSPANKDRPASVADFVNKAHAALHHGCHLLVIDLHSPGPHDPQGIHGAIWEDFDPADYDLPADKPLTLAAYVAGTLPEAYLEHVAVGDPLPDMPLFVAPDSHIDVPLEATYRAAYQGVPAYWRGVIEGPQAPEQG